MRPITCYFCDECSPKKAEYSLSTWDSHKKKKLSGKAVCCECLATMLKDTGPFNDQPGYVILERIDDGTV